MIFCIDFDGTLVEHEYPRIGESVPHAIRVINRLVENQHRIILYTMRSGVELDEAVVYCEKYGIPLYGINNNPTQSDWSKSPKVYAQVYRAARWANYLGDREDARGVRQYTCMLKHN